MGTIGDCYDNSMMESFWGTMQLELLDSRTWRTRAELANAIFEWIECCTTPSGAIPASECSALWTTKQPTGPQTKITDPTPSVSGVRANLTSALTGEGAVLASDRHVHLAHPLRDPRAAARRPGWRTDFHALAAIRRALMPGRLEPRGSLGSHEEREAPLLHRIRGTPLRSDTPRNHDHDHGE